MQSESPRRAGGAGRGGGWHGSHRIGSRRGDRWAGAWRVCADTRAEQVTHEHISLPVDVMSGKAGTDLVP